MIGAPEPDTTRPGALRVDEDPNRTRTSPAPISDAMDANHTDSGRGFGANRTTHMHWGVDLVQSPTDPDGVVAPERSSVVKVWLDNKTAPFVGYGPGGVLLKGLTTGVYHLLGHLDPGAWSDADRPTIGEVFETGQFVGHTAPTGSDGVGKATPHVHWEVRVQPIDDPTTRQANTLDPIDWTHGIATPATATSRGTLTEKTKNGIPWWVWALGLYAISKRRR